MKKSVKKQTIINVYPMLNDASLGKMEVVDRFVFIKALRPLKKIYTEYSDFREDAVNRLKPENYEKIVENVQRFNQMGQEEREAALKDKEITDALQANGEFNLNIEMCFRDELAREIELEIAPLSEDAFGKLMESNQQWNAGQIIELQDLLCE